MRKLDKVTRVLVKLTEIALWIGSVGMVVGMVLTLVMGERAVMYGPEDWGASLSCLGFELVPIAADGALYMAALRFFLVGGAILLAIMAVAMGNVYLILRQAEEGTPFRPENVERVRRIGYLLLAVPVVGLALTVAARLMLGADRVELYMDLSSLLPGLVVLSLAQFFARGVELETDAEGLV